MSSPASNTHRLSGLPLSTPHLSDPALRDHSSLPKQQKLFSPQITSQSNDIDPFDSVHVKLTNNVDVRAVQKSTAGNDKLKSKRIAMCIPSIRPDSE
jgi:hypothetical protein